MSQCEKYYINKFDKYFTKYTMSTVSRNFQNENVRYKMNRYILHTVFLVIILLFMIANICYHYAYIGQN